MQLLGVMLYVKDFERMKRFYADLLGIQPMNQNATDVWASFESDGLQFALHAIPPDIAEEIEIASPARPRENEPVKLILNAKDVERERERLELMGVQIIRRQWQRPGEACDAVDPEGNIFQLSSWVSERSTT